jgi:hypothetical protein
MHCKKTKNLGANLSFLVYNSFSLRSDPTLNYLCSPLVATVGTTSSGAVDNMAEIRDVGGSDLCSLALFIRF